MTVTGRNIDIIIVISKSRYLKWKKKEKESRNQLHNDFHEQGEN